MKLELSKISYFLIFVTLLISFNSLLYFNIDNLPEIILYIIALVIPLIRIIKYTFATNTRIIDNQIPKFVYALIDIGITILLVAQISMLVDSISWLISGNPAVVNNISNFGFWMIAMMVYIAVHNIGNRQSLIRNSAYVLAVFDILLIPVLLLYIVSSGYGGLLSASSLGQLDMTINTIISIFPLLSILLFARNTRTEEEKMASMLYPALFWMIAIFSLVVLAVSGTTNQVVVANDGTYAVSFFENLRQANILNIFDYDIATLAAGYSFLNGILVILLLTLIKDALYERSCIYVRKNEYIDDSGMKIVYKKRKALQNVVVFAILIMFLVLISPSLYDLTMYISNIATVAALFLNLIFISIIGIHITKQSDEPGFIKGLAIYLMSISLGLIIIFFIG